MDLIVGVSVLGGSSVVARSSTRRPISTALIASAVVALLSLAAAGASLASPLKPPFEHYTLTYRASVPAQGSLAITSPAPVESSPCEHISTAIHASSSVQVVESYAVTFGRYHARGERRHLAFLYKPVIHSVIGSAEGTEVESLPAGCPPLLPQIYTLENDTCRQQIGAEEASLDFDANPAYTMFGAEFGLRIRAIGQSTCTGNTDPGTGGVPPETDLFDYGSPSGEGPTPAGGSIAFSASGIEHGRTFHGHVELSPAEIPASSQGIEPGFDGVNQRVWSFSSSPSATLTLAPTRGGH